MISKKLSLDDILELFKGSYNDYLLGIGLFKSNIEHFDNHSINVIMYLIRMKDWNDIRAEYTDFIRINHTIYYEKVWGNPKYEDIKDHIYKITLKHLLI